MAFSTYPDGADDDDITHQMISNVYDIDNIWTSDKKVWELSLLFIIT